MYKVYGFKQERAGPRLNPQSSVAALFFEFFLNPRPGEVYNLGGDGENTLSIPETIGKLEEMGFELEYEVTSQNRTGDHICYARTFRTTEAMGTKWIRHTKSKTAAFKISYEAISNFNPKLDIYA